MNMTFFKQPLVENWENSMWGLICTYQLWTPVSQRFELVTYNTINSKKQLDVSQKVCSLKMIGTSSLHLPFFLGNFFFDN